MIDVLQQTLFKFLDHQIPPLEFEQWVYATPALEQFFPSEIYLELIAHNYSHRLTYHTIETLIMPLINQGEYEAWRLRDRLTTLIDGYSIHNFESTCNLIECIYDLYCEGYSFLGDFLEYELAIIGIDDSMHTEWDAIDSSIKQNLLRSFYPQIIHDAHKVLFWLDQGLIVPNGWGNISSDYEDYRHPLDN